MNPSPEAVAAVRSHVTDWTPADAAIAAALNAPAVANPVPQPTVPKPFTVTSLMGLLDAAALGKVYGRPAVVAFRDDCVSQDRTAVANWVALAYAAGDVTQAQHDAMMAAVTATELDPSWPAQVGWALANLGRAVDPEDIAAARQGA